MSKRFAMVLGSTCVALLLPAAAFGQSKKCGSSSSTSMRTPTFQCGPCAPNRSSFQQSSSMTTGMGQFRQPNNPLGFQPNPQLQMGMLLNQQFQQGLLQQVNFQYMLQNQLKQQLLMYAYEAPTENLQRGLKNSNAFVRWAASVELNRRWKTEQSIAKATPQAATRLSLSSETAMAATTTTPPRRVQTNTPARVTPIGQTLLLQMGIPK